ncbi:hypothetical protein ACRAWG_01215 [Methylobacterium sp. P31]
MRRPIVCEAREVASRKGAPHAASGAGIRLDLVFGRLPEKALAEFAADRRIRAIGLVMPTKLIVPNDVAAV